MLIPYLVDCLLCTDGIVTKHYPDSDEQGNKTYYTEPCTACTDGLRVAGYIDVSDIDDKIKDVLDKCNDIFDEIKEI